MFCLFSKGGQAGSTAKSPKAAARKYELRGVKWASSVCQTVDDNAAY